MLGFVLTFALLYSLGAFISRWRLLSESFPMRREPLEVNIAVIILLVELGFAAWAWHLWITTP